MTSTTYKLLDPLTALSWPVLPLTALTAHWIRLSFTNLNKGGQAVKNHKVQG